MKTKTKKTKPPPKKRGRGRPRKDNGGRREISVSLSHSLVRELDAFVVDLKKVTKGTSRGDVLSDALRDWPPFIRWGLK